MHIFFLSNQFASRKPIFTNYLKFKGSVSLVKLSMFRFNEKKMTHIRLSKEIHAHLFLSNFASQTHIHKTFIKFKGSVSLVIPMFRFVNIYQLRRSAIQKLDCRLVPDLRLSLSVGLEECVLRR